MGKEGFYKAEVIVNGIKYEKTFFPQSWPREKVIHKIIEAYENFIKSSAKYVIEKNGKLRFSGFTKEGIEIEMYITKNGKITTAYPKIL